MMREILYYRTTLTGRQIPVCGGMIYNYIQSVLGEWASITSDWLYIKEDICCNKDTAHNHIHSFSPSANLTQAMPLRNGH